ncbi:MAG TPA: hypothetical protein VJN71_09445 [Nitrososphaerales archaeon]|nr:hypothetical protein [Nitrososphaerales archaeon]
MTQDEILADVRQMIRRSEKDPLLKWAKEPKSSVGNENLKQRILCEQDQVQKYLDRGYAPKFEMKNGSVVMELDNS